MRLVPPFLALLVLSAAPAAFAQWTTQSPVPTYLDVRGVAAPAPDRVFIATDDNQFDDGGALWESADGGATWTQLDVPFNTRTSLYGLFFLDDQRGWAYGNENYRTTDGGTTWTPIDTLGTVNVMAFYTPTFGSASTNGGPLVTHDAGLSWVPSPDTLVTYSLADDLIGLGATAFGVTFEGVYRTTDGGLTFARVLAGNPEEPDNGEAVAFLSATVAVAIVEDTFYRSTVALLAAPGARFAHPGGGWPLSREGGPVQSWNAASRGFTGEESLAETFTGFDTYWYIWSLSNPRTEILRAK